MTCKIYLLTNRVNGKIYVGQTWLQLSQRMGKNGKGYQECPHLNGAIQKYGSSNFEYTILSECDTQEEADRLEVEYIEKLNCRNSKVGYNISPGGLGGKRSVETTTKIVESRMEDQETQNKVITAYKRGMTISEIKKTFGFGGNGKVYRILDKNSMERTNNFSKWVGKAHSEETKLKMAKSRSKYWNEKRNNQ